MEASQTLDSLTPHGQDCVQTDALMLQRAVEKLVRFGQQLGVSSEDMISLLDSGISVADLLAFLAARRIGAA